MTNDNMITLSAGNVEVIIDAEHGSRLSSVRFGETELLVQRNSDDSFSWGCYPMLECAIAHQLCSSRDSWSCA
jgi:hypothetical protein